LAICDFVPTPPAKSGARLLEGIIEPFFGDAVDSSYQFPEIVGRRSGR